MWKHCMPFHILCEASGGYLVWNDAKLVTVLTLSNPCWALLAGWLSVNHLGSAQHVCPVFWGKPCLEQVLVDCRTIFVFVCFRLLCIPKARGPTGAFERGGGHASMSSPCGGPREPSSPGDHGEPHWHSMADPQTTTNGSGAHPSGPLPHLLCYQVSPWNTSCMKQHSQMSLFTEKI